MAKYSVTYSCGHSDTVYLVGPNKERERKLEWLADQGLCPACFAEDCKRRKEAEMQKKADAAKALELPDLTGSPKQIKWAMDIRDQFIKAVERASEGVKKHPTANHVMTALMDNGMLHAEAKWWIDNRETFLVCVENIENAITALLGYFGLTPPPPREEILDRLWEVGMSTMTTDELYRLLERIAAGEKPQKGVTAIADHEIALAAEQEARNTVRPAEPRTPEKAVIRIHPVEEDKNNITVYTPEYCESVVYLLKKMGFVRQSGLWMLKVKRNWASATDRIIEIAVTILSKGYIVAVPYDWMVDRVVKADYEPLNTRSIRATTDGRFAISWDRDDGDFYDTTKRLPGAKWSSEYRSMRVPPESFREVLDFAEMFKFQFSAAAAKLANTAEVAHEQSLVADVRPKKGDLPEPISQVPEKLAMPSDAEIEETYEALRDDD